MDSRRAIPVFLVICVCLILGVLARWFLETDVVAQSDLGTVVAADSLASWSPQRDLIPAVRVEVPGVKSTAPAEASESSDVPATRRFSGVVVSDAGIPMAGFTITTRPLWYSMFRGSRDEHEALLGQAKTGKDGRFVLDLPSLVYSESHVLCHISKDFVTYKEGELLLSTGLVLRLPPDEAWSISGTIRTTGESVGPLKIVLCIESESVGGFGSNLLPVTLVTTRKKDGFVSMRGLVGPLLLEEGQLTMFASTLQDEPVATLRFKGVDQLEAMVQSGLEIPVKETEVPLPGHPSVDQFEKVRVVFQERCSFNQAPQWTRLDGDSSFVGIFGPGEFIVIARAENGTELMGHYAAGKALKWSIEKPFREVLSVVLEDGKGAPVSGVYLGCSPVVGGGSPFLSWPGLTESEQTDKDGRVQFNLPEGKYRVEVLNSAIGVREYARTVRDMDVPGPEQRLRVQRVALMSVDVRFEPRRDDKPPLNIMLREIGQRNWLTREIGYPNYSCIMGGIKPGKYHVIGWCDQYELDTYLVVPYATQTQRIEFTLYRSTKLTGKVLDSKGAPVSSAEIVVIRPDGYPRTPWKTTKSLSDGSFTAWLGPRDTALLITSDGKRKRVEVKGDEVVVSL